MHQHWNIDEHHLRATMPSKCSSPVIKKLREDIKEAKVAGSEKFFSEETSQKLCFFVRISENDLQEQNKIYQWRVQCAENGENVVGVCQYKLQTKGNIYNPNHLFKIEMDTCKSNFWQFKNFSLTKCIKLIREGLTGANQLFQYFTPVEFTDKMICIDNQGRVKVWMEDHYYLNPRNMLYPSKTKSVSLKESLHSLISVFEKKCSKTKLSEKFFNLISNRSTVSEIMNLIDEFERNEHLFPLSSFMKNSISTAAQPESQEKTLSSSSKKVSPLVLLAPKINLANSFKFSQAKSMELKSLPLSPLPSCLKNKVRNAEVYRSGDSEPNKNKSQNVWKHVSENQQNEYENESQNEYEKKYEKKYEKQCKNENDHENKCQNLRQWAQNEHSEKNMGAFEGKVREGKKTLNISEILQEERISSGHLSRNGNEHKGMFCCKGNSEKYYGRNWEIVEKGESGNDQRNYLGKIDRFLNKSEENCDFGNLKESYTHNDNDKREEINDECENCPEIEKDKNPINKIISENGWNWNNNIGSLLEGIPVEESFHEGCEPEINSEYQKNFMFSPLYRMCKEVKEFEIEDYDV